MIRDNKPDWFTMPDAPGRGPGATGRYNRTPLAGAVLPTRSSHRPGWLGGLGPEQPMPGGQAANGALVQAGRWVSGLRSSRLAKTAVMPGDKNTVIKPDFEMCPICGGGGGGR